MLFDSWQFASCFPVLVLFYLVLPHRWRHAMLLVASVVFYMAFIPAYILILVFTIRLDYLAGLAIAGSEGVRRKAWLVASLISNLGVLAVFKYDRFFGRNIASWTGGHVTDGAIRPPFQKLPWVSGR